jgi:hypothetical protein
MPEVSSATQLGHLIHVLLRPDAPRDEEACERLAARLREAGIDCRLAEPAEPNLEDVFVALLAGERLDTTEGAEATWA